MSENHVTELLKRLRPGDKYASDELLDIVYDELRQLAASKLKQEKSGQTLQATALVHEAYLRLVGSIEDVNWDSRNHFFASAAEAMRRILIENARRKKAMKRGGGMIRTVLSSSVAGVQADDVDLLELDEALGALEAEDAQAALLVKLRFFSGMTMSQSAEVLDLSLRSAERLWTFAKAWLYEELR